MKRSQYLALALGAMALVACETRIDPNATTGGNGNGSGGAINVEQKQRSLVIEHTGAWCQYCPRGAFNLAQVIANHDEDVLGVAVHDGDGLAVQTALDFYAAFTPGGFPDFYFGSQGGINGSSLDGLVTAFNETVPAIGVGMKKLSQDTVKIDVRGRFTAFRDTIYNELYMNAYFLNGPVAGAASTVWGDMMQSDNVTSDWLTDMNDTSYWNHQYLDNQGGIVIDSGDVYTHEHAVVEHGSLSFEGELVASGAISTDQSAAADFSFLIDPKWNMEGATIVVILWHKTIGGSLEYVNGVNYHLD